MSTFRVGQKVVCIDGSFDNLFYDEEAPVEGSIYTIRGIDADCLSLCEIVNPPHQYNEGFYEALFWSYRFRPLAYKSQSLEHDVAQFKQMSRQLPAPVKEPTT